MNADTNRPKMSAPTPETDNLARGNHVVPTEWAEQLERERDEANYFIKELSEADGQLKVRMAELCDVLQKAERERDEAREQRDCLHELHNKNAIHSKELLELCGTLRKERDEARQRASDLAIGVKVADCMYDYGKYSVALREAKIKARHLQDLTRAAYDEVEKLEDQEGTK